MRFNRSLVAPLMLAAVTGDIARQAAAAPVAQKNTPPPPAPPADAAPVTRENRYNKLFTGIIFSTPTSAATYGEVTERQSKKMIDVLIELGGTGTYLRGAIKAVRQPGQKTAKAEFSFHGTQYRSSVVVEGESAKAELAAWKAETCAAGKLWRSEQATVVNVADVDLDDVEF